jgi:hypothetical protein
MAPAKVNSLSSQLTGVMGEPFSPLARGEAIVKTTPPAMAPVVIAKKAAHVVNNAAHAAAHTIGNVGRRTEHINRSDSFVSKAIRFVRADEYTYVASNYDRFIIVLNIASFILGIMTLVWFVTLWAKNGKRPYSSFVFGIPEKESKLDGFNMFNTVSTFIKGAITVFAFVASIMQLRIIFKHNDFRKRVDEAGGIPVVRL